MNCREFEIQAIARMIETAGQPPSREMLEHQRNCPLCAQAAGGLARLGTALSREGAALRQARSPRIFAPASSNLAQPARQMRLWWLAPVAAAAVLAFFLLGRGGPPPAVRTPEIAPAVAQLDPVVNEIGLAAPSEDQARDEAEESIAAGDAALVLADDEPWAGALTISAPSLLTDGAPLASTYDDASERDGVTVSSWSPALPAAPSLSLGTSWTDEDLETFDLWSTTHENVDTQELDLRSDHGGLDRDAGVVG